MEDTKSLIFRYLPWVKSLAILGLAALSVFLTVQLWLVNIPNRSFFPYLTARLAPAAPERAADLVRPFRIISGTGDGYFDIMYSNIAGSNFWVYGESAITAILQSGIFVDRTETDMPYILENPVLIYEYAFNMNPATFTQAFDQRTGLLTDAGIPCFRAVAVLPPQNADDSLGVFFIRDDYTWQFTLAPTGRRFNNVFQGIEIPSSSNPYRRFVPTESPLGFVPHFHENFSYHPLIVTNPYENHSGLLQLAFIRSQVEHFFANPATINHEAVNVIYTFRNLNTVVRYLPWDVLEYTSFRTIGRDAPDFIADFSAAIAFIDNDPNVTNEFFLAGYDARGRENVFWFDYAVNDFPLVLTQYWHSGPDCTNPLSHFIEVVVENGRVIRYRKIPFTFEADTSVSASLISGILDRPIGFVIEPGLRSQQDISLRTIDTE